MSAPVDVMEVFARAEGQARMVAGLAGDPRARQLLKDLAAARAAVAELVDADHEYDAACIHVGEAMWGSREQRKLAQVRSARADARRIAALASIKGGAA